MRYFLNRILKKTGYKLIELRDIKQPKIVKEEQNNFNALNGCVDSPFDEVPFAGETLQYVMQNIEFKNVLDVGSGEGKHSDVFKLFDKEVTSIDFGKSIYFEKRSANHTCIFGDYYTYEFENKFDLIWASHVLEHQPNPNLFLKKIFNDLKEGGVLAITVPPLKHEIVGGHVTLWNAGLLLYQLVLAGFNCKYASIKSYGYNISIVLSKKSIIELPELSYDSGDIRILSDYFPDGLKEPFDGNIKLLNWK